MASVLLSSSHYTRILGVKPRYSFSFVPSQSCISMYVSITGIMKGVKLDARDEATAQDPKSFGIIHGDLNISNFFWTAPNAEHPQGTQSLLFIVFSCLLSPQF